MNMSCKGQIQGLYFQGLMMYQDKTRLFSSFSGIRSSLTNITSGAQSLSDRGFSQNVFDQPIRRFPILLTILMVFICSVQYQMIHAANMRYNYSIDC